MVDSAVWSDPPNNQWGNVGLWTYNSSLDTKSAHDEVILQIDYERSKTSPPPSTPTVYSHGKCLLLLGVDPKIPSWSGYQQALDKYCV